MAQQAEQARQAMGQTLHEMADRLREAADPRALTQEYPWISVGTAAVVGFLAASAITPSKEESLKERLASLFPKEAFQAPPAAAAASWQGPPKPGLFAGITGPLLDSLKTALVSTLSSAVTAKVHQTAAEAEQAGDGQPQGSNKSSDPAAQI